MIVEVAIHTERERERESMLEPYLPGFSPIPTPAKGKKTETERRRNPFDLKENSNKNDVITNPFKSTPIRRHERTIGIETPPKKGDSFEEDAKTPSPRLENKTERLETLLTPESKWQKKDNCSICSVTFTTTKRRHHCRKCGKSTCLKCSRCRLVTDPSREEVRVCVRCSRDMLRSELELKMVRAEISVLKKELVDVRRMYNEEKELNSKYSSDIGRLNAVIGEQNRRASDQSKEMARMSSTLAALTEKINYCEKDQMRLREDHLRALERQRSECDERIQSTRNRLDETRRLSTTEAGISHDVTESDPKASRTNNGNEIVRSASVPGRRPPTRPKTAENSCSCLVM